MIDEKRQKIGQLKRRYIAYNKLNMLCSRIFKNSFAFFVPSDGFKIWYSPNIKEVFVRINKNLFQKPSLKLPENVYFILSLFGASVNVLQG